MATGATRSYDLQQVQAQAMASTTTSLMRGRRKRWRKLDWMRRRCVRRQVRPCRLREG